MLELKNIKKTYISGDEKVEALKGINLKFRESEFVSILGQSGCGKTTLLNIIGGLDRYTSGDLIINGRSTKKFKDRDWDAYRNYKVGFIFQSYNLISHQTILSNVELALTIGGISKKERKERAIKALEEVGLKDHINKKPNQLSGGQMQRVAIARALVNNPDIILADEPTGALDTKTSVQVMEILKKISEKKLIIMVTHNPELAEKYSNRIIRILDGIITEDTKPVSEDEEIEKIETNKMHKTSMKLWTSFRLSLNNLLTKKGRTILVAFAGSIGIIGIALVQSISNGFQAYVDSIQEETLTSYPLTIMQETTDITGTLLAMTSEDNKNNENGNIKEEQYISKVLANLSTNDLKNFKKYLNENYIEVSSDISSIKYGYSVEPMIYGIDSTQKIVKLSPNNLFSSSLGMGMMSSYASIYSQMIDDQEMLNNSYDILAGHFPQNYDEMIIVLSDKNSISDLLVYSLGLRNTQELTDIVTKIMNGETVDINNEALEFSYDDLMNIELKLIMPGDIYKYNSKYDIYEDMSQDEEYMKKLYENAINLKIVGIVTAKEGITSAALSPGVSYTSALVDYIMDNSANTDIVKKQLENQNIDVLSGKKFNENNNNLGLDFTDLISIDKKKLQSAFNIKINQKELENETQGYISEIANSINTDTKPAKQDFMNNLNNLAYGLVKQIRGDVSENDSDRIVEEYLNGNEASKIMLSLEQKYIIPKDTFKSTYSGILKGMLKVYIKAYNIAQSLETKNAQNVENISSYTSEDIQNAIDALPDEVKEVVESIPEETQKVMESFQENVKDIDIAETLIKVYTKSCAIQMTGETMANIMTEAVMKRDVLTKVGELTGNLASSFATSFNIDQNKIASAFKMKITEEEITRIVTAMLSKTETNAKTNLINFGYQEKEEPTYISFYFNNFDGKEHFINFIDSYNEKVKFEGEEDREINYTDTTGILMSSVKTIVNAVTYVLIAFISISLVVSSIMIGIITYISVYERTKEIGILRAIGASKRNISSIFNAETFIIGLLSGLFGIGVTYIAIPIINNVLHHFTGNIPLNAAFYASNAITLIVLSVILTLIGGFIPSKAASKKDPVIALRTE